MSLRKRLLVKPPSTGLVPSEHFGVVLYEGDGASTHSINGGKFGAGAYFGGSADVTLPFNLQNTPFTISFWAKDTLSSTNYYLIANHSGSTQTGWYIGGNGSSGTAYVFRFNSGNTSYFNFTSSTVDDSDWHHVVMTFDNTTNTNGAKIYINGSLDTQATSGSTGNVSFTNSTTLLMKEPGGSLRSKGLLDQVRIFKKALSSSEVSTLYAETASTVESLDPLSEDTTDTLQVLGDSSCIATYRFENNEDDLSGNYDLTGNAIQYAAGRYGQAASFNGSSSYAQITSSAPQDSSGVMSVSFWAKTTSTSRACFFIAEAPDPNKEFLKLENFGYQGTNSFRVSYDNNMLSNIDNVAISDGQWHHIVITAGNGNVKTYKDNSLLATQSVTITDRTLDNFVIGYRKYNNDLYFNGEIDQVRIFNKALSASEVTTLYNENSLVASYRFEGNANDDTRNYDGTASNVTYEYGLGFTPDFIWLKRRDANNYSYRVFDTTRGATKLIRTNETTAEQTDANTLKSFDTGGFTVGSNTYVNIDGGDFVAWCLKANGGTTSSNTNGTITSTVQVNNTAGFSIVKWTGTTTTSDTIGHGLSTAPQIVILKNLDATSDWFVYTTLIDGSLDYIRLNTTGAKGNSGRNAPTSTVFDQTTLGSSISAGNECIGYCFHSVDSFSKFGTYTGNGNANGPIVETGFEPAFVMVKNTTSGSADDWHIFDNKRDLTNPKSHRLKANTSDAESSTDTGFDFLSNGFQLLGTSGARNENNNIYLYMAFAADPDTEAPTVAKSFTAITYTGNGTSLDLDTGFKPGLIWTKPRSYADNNQLWDIVRGAGWTVYSNSTNAENPTIRLDGVSSFNDDGFSIGNWNNINVNGSTYAAWAWKADDNEPTIFGGPAVAVYKFEDNANDVTTNYNGTANSITYATGKFNKAAVFNGSTGDIDLPSDIESSTMAVSLWLYSDVNAPTDKIVIEFDNGYGLNFVSFASGKIAAQYANANSNHTLSNSTISSGQWYHIAANFRSGASDLWIDGVKQTGGTVTDYLTSDQNTIGSRRTGQFFDGMIDQVRIYNGNFQQEQVTELYNETASQNDDLTLGAPAETIISANANAGFSIVKYEGTATSGRQVPHGLSAAPEMIIIKNLDTVIAWKIGHTTIGWTKYLEFDTGAEASSSGVWNDTAPTSTTFTLGSINSVNGSAQSYIAYCFHSVSNYSKIGSYSGSGASGNAQNVGFTPDWLMVKRYVGAASQWVIIDSVRGTKALYADLSNAESSESRIFLNSTGFEFTGSAFNESGTQWIYMAFKIN